MMVLWIPLKKRKWLTRDVMYTSVTHAGLIHVTDLVNIAVLTALLVLSIQMKRGKCLAHDIMSHMPASLASQT